MKNSRILFVILAIFIFVSCNKDENLNEGENQDQNEGEDEDTLESCSTNSGYFEIEIAGNKHELQIDDEATFFILYGAYEENQNGFGVDGNDQNGKSINIEGNITGKLTQGTHTLDFQNFDFIDIAVDTLDCYTSEVTFEIILSNLSLYEAIYEPIKGTFNGVAHSYPWSNGVPPADTILFSGEFCLNGLIL